MRSDNLPTSGNITGSQAFVSGTKTDFTFGTAPAGIILHLSIIILRLVEQVVLMHLQSTEQQLQ